MGRSTHSHRTLRAGASALAAACLILALGACDTGDGKTLKDPVGTVPPPATTLPGTIDDLTPAEQAPDSFVGEIVPTDGLGSLPAEPAGFRLFAPWLDATTIDTRYTCDGENVAPPLSWDAVPPEATELAIAVVDESIVNGPPFVHWVIAGLDPAAGSLLEGDVPLGAVQALNFFGEVGWGGPCPPPGDSPHLYRFTVYALNQQVELADGTPATDLLEFVESVAVASDDVTGTYGR